MSAELVALVASRFDERDAGLRTRDPLGFPGYRESLDDRESAVWGDAVVDGVACVLVAFDFGFLGGSMGVVAGEKVARAFDHARRLGRPVVTVTASGGARMQEGMVALVQMAKTAEARRRHAASGGGHVAVLTSPTTGGVYASFASLADVVVAEAGATIGFAGPRVVEELTGQRPPPDVHKAEFAWRHGTVDAVVERDAMRSVVGAALRGLTPDAPAARRPDTKKRTDAGTESPFEPWTVVQRARDPSRPKGPAILDAVLTDRVALAGGLECGMVARLGRWGPGGLRVAALAHDSTGTGRITPAGFELARRVARLAGRLGLPLVSVIDTRGADPLPESEAQGVAREIALTFAEFLGCRAPTVAVVTGEGGSGGALATAVCDRVLMAENSIFSVIAPEGAASILYRDGKRAPEVAGLLKLTAHDLVRLRIADEVVPEDVEAMGDAVAHCLDSLASQPAAARLARRRRRWRGAGNRWLGA